jgi:hypothetical protein
VDTGEVVAGNGHVVPIGRLCPDADVPDGIKEEAAADDVVMTEDSDGGDEDRWVVVAAG